MPRGPRRQTETEGMAGPQNCKNPRRCSVKRHVRSTRADGSNSPAHECQLCAVQTAPEATGRADRAGWERELKSRAGGRGMEGEAVATPGISAAGRFVFVPLVGGPRWAGPLFRAP